MADNVTISASTAYAFLPDGTAFATDNIGGVNYQRIKLTWGADGTATDASSTAALPIAVSTSTGIIGAVMPSTQWTVTTTPSSQMTVSVTPTTQFTVANATSTGVIGAVMPSTNWDVNAVQSGTWSIGVTSSTLPIGSVQQHGAPWSVSVTSSTIVRGSILPSSTWDVNAIQSGTWNVGTLTSITNAVGITSSTAIRGAVMPSTQWTVSVTPTTQFTVTTTPSTQMTVSVTPTTQFTVSIGTSTATIGAVTQASSNWSVTQGTTSWRMNTNYLNTKELTNVNIIATSTAIGFPNKLVTETASQTIRVYRLYISALTACRFQVAGSTTTSTVPLAEFCLPANGAIDLEHDISGEPLFVSNSGGAFALGQNISAAAAILTGFVQYTKS